VLLAVVLDQLQGEFSRLGDDDRFGESDVGVVGFPYAAADGPAGAVLAGAGVVIKEPAHGPAFLGIVRRRVSEPDGIARVAVLSKAPPD